MSFMEKFVGVFANSNQPDPVGASDVPWYVKIAGNILGTVGGFFAILFGLYNVLSVITLNIWCLIGGVVQICVGITVIGFEAPICCPIAFVKENAAKMDSRPRWHRAAFYCCIAIPPIIMCPGLGSLFGCGLIFGTGVLYGMLALGKKASMEDMRQAAANSGLANTTPTTNDRASIVNNAQPFSFTGTVGTDSNV